MAETAVSLGLFYTNTFYNIKHCFIKLTIFLIPFTMVLDKRLKWNQNDLINYLKMTCKIKKHQLLCNKTTKFIG